MQLLNTTEELQRFPSTQSIFLYSDREIDQSFLDLNIILFRLQDESNIKLAEPYTYSLGYLKETFDKVPMNYKSEPFMDGYKVTCTPKQPLNLDSKFCIYISNNLKNKVIDVVKNDSKSLSSVEVKLNSTDFYDTSYTLTVVKSSSYKEGKNVIQYRIDNGPIKQLNIRETSTVSLPTSTVYFKDLPYIEGESFTITIKNDSTVNNEYQYIIKTVASSSITPIDVKDKSTSLSNQAILDFYKNKEVNTSTIPEYVLPKYIDSNIFAIKIPEGYKLDVSVINSLKNQLSIAFNNYLLKSMKLYNPLHTYKIVLYMDDFNNELIFEVLYTDDTNQKNPIIFDFSGVM